MTTTSGILGAFIVGASGAATDDFYGYFNILSRNAAYFDASVELRKIQGQNFDASAIVYQEERKPGVNILSPNILTTEDVAGSSIYFDAEASGLDGRFIARTAWYFSDDMSTSGSMNTSSGTYMTEHYFTESGIFDVLFVAIDNYGCVNSDRVKIDTTSGITVHEIALTAVPESGVGPLSVAFSGVISTAPFPIVDSSLSFGDGTFSASTISIYKVYPVIGCYIRVFRARDTRGFIVTDTTVIGVNN